MRLIDADAAKRKIIEEIVVHLPKFNPAGFAIITAVAKMFDCEDDFPTVDAEPARHGKWTAINLYCNHAREFKCSACGDSVYYEYDTRFCDYDFCPNCGAKMDGGDSS